MTWRWIYFAHLFYPRSLPFFPFFRLSLSFFVSFLLSSFSEDLPSLSPLSLFYLHLLSHPLTTSVQLALLPSHFFRSLPLFLYPPPFFLSSSPSSESPLPPPPSRSATLGTPNCPCNCRGEVASSPNCQGH